MAHLQECITTQRTTLSKLLRDDMHQLAARCLPRLEARAELEDLLQEAIQGFALCKNLYVLDSSGNQLTSNIQKQLRDTRHFGRDRSDCPFMDGVSPGTDFKLSEAYISRIEKRPSLSAVQAIRNPQQHHHGFLLADFDLRELPHTEDIYRESQHWRQIKGDPAIRSGLFYNERNESLMDPYLEDVFSLVYELMVGHGVYHTKLHLSSSRLSMWHVDDPLIYHVLTVEELTDPDICLAIPKRPYHERAEISPQDLERIFQMFHVLRFGDENIYLRAASINLINGMVCLNFSCDGTHHMRYEEFLEKNTDFWYGESCNMLGD